MYLIENPVLQRELLVNLRMPRAFLLLLLYQVVLSCVVYFAWPETSRLDLSGDERPESAGRLVDMFFLGQYVLASLMAPSFAAGAITGEKERATYELLLASPLRPGAIVLGKLVASLTHLAVLIFASLPIIMICLPLGGMSLFEVLAAYLGLIVSVISFGMISVACSSYFKRTAASLVVSYLLILPLALGAVLCWNALAAEGRFRLLLTVTLVPAAGAAVCIALFANTAARLLHPPDVGSEGKEVVDLEEESKEVVGLVINRDQFPDKLFAPPKRDDLMDDGANPVYDKEIRSEIFSQGTLMLRLVIQISMLVAIPLMAGCLYIWPQNAPWYIGYVVLFNMLVGPVFSAGSVCSERERQTLDLLLTTIITPGQILWGKLIAGLRVSSVLTMFLLWPLLLACVMVPDYWRNLGSVAAYLGIVLMTCLTTAMLALFCSVLMHKTSMSLMATYVGILLLFGLPVAVRAFTEFIDPDQTGAEIVRRIEAEQQFGRTSAEIARTLSQGTTMAGRTQPWTAEEVDAISLRLISKRWLAMAGTTSPFAASFSVPYIPGDATDDPIARPGSWALFAAFVAWSGVLNLGLLVVMGWMFNSRWRVSMG